MKKTTPLVQAAPIFGTRQVEFKEFATNFPWSQDFQSLNAILSEVPKEIHQQQEPAKVNLPT